MTPQKVYPQARQALGAAGIRKNNNAILTNPCDYVDQFRQAMMDEGINYREEITADGDLHRGHVEGDASNSRNLAYKLHLDNIPAGYFEDFKRGIKKTWRADTGRKLTHQELISQQAKIDEQRHQRAIEQHNRQEAAAAKATYLWDCGRPSANHPYLAEKKIKAHKTRQIKNSLLIPLYDINSRLVSLQFISPSGEKRFLSGGRKQGCFCIIGDLIEKILICEGFATGASLHEHTGQRVVVAFDAGNLLPVAEIIRSKHHDIEIIIAGDNDESGVGQKAANDAAAAVGGKVLIPPVAGMDWNDYLNAGGEHV